MNVAHTSTVKRIYCNFLGHQMGKEKYLEREGLKLLGTSHLDSDYAPLQRQNTNIDPLA